MVCIGRVWALMSFFFSPDYFFFLSSFFSVSGSGWYHVSSELGTSCKTARIRPGFAVESITLQHCSRLENIRSYAT